MEDAPETVKAAVWRLDPALRGVCWQPLAGGRTNRLWRAGDLTIKKFTADAASPLFPNDAAAEARALELFAPLGIAPRLRAAGADWLVYDHADGAVWSGDPAPVERALHRLHGAKVPDGTFRLAPNGSGAVLAHAALRKGAGTAAAQAHRPLGSARSATSCTPPPTPSFWASA